MQRPSQHLADWTKDFESMKEIRRLGEGSFGVVMLLENEETHELIALKSVDVNKSSDSQKAFFDFINEIEGLIHLIHPCVLEIVGYSLPRADRPGRIGTKFAANGSLKQAIEQRRLGKAPEFMNDTGIAIIVCGIVLGMQFIHSQNLIHRDLKPSNIFLDEGGFARIGDFGNSRLGDLDFTLTKGVGSPFYMAPETFDEDDYTVRVDVYSFALILYELLVGEPVFPPAIALGTLMDKIMNGIRPELPESMNATAKNIIETGWAVDPKVRYSFDEIWSRLARINFRLTSNVNSSKVLEFVSWVATTDPAGVRLTPVVEDSESPAEERFPQPRNLFPIGSRISGE
jgi:serine/threonine protein kinase